MPKSILSTKNYQMFDYNTGQNRLLNIEEHKGLLESMKEYGFLDCFPIVVTRNGNGNGSLLVVDGQHRLNFAEKLGLPVHYVEVKTSFDVAKINISTRIWKPKDYAQKFAASGIKPYEEGLEFVEQHKLPVGIAFALLAGVTAFTNIDDQFKNGTFKIKDRPWADAVAGIYVPLVKMSSTLKKSTRLLEACMAVCRVPDFDSRRLLKGAALCREKLIPYSTKDAYLTMLEDIYNFRRQHLVGLKNAATMAMRERNATQVRKAQAEAKRQNGK